MISRYPAPAVIGRLMAGTLLAVFVSAFGTIPVKAQDAAETTGKAKPEKLFASAQTLAITLHAPWRDLVQQEKNKNPYFATIEFSDSLGQSHSISLMVERRGLTRQTVCKFPPIRLRFDKEAVKGTVFAGQKSLKMVTHCDRGDRWEQYYLKEMLAYSMFNLMTERSFRVRPLEVTYIDSENNATENSRFAFLIEDDSDVAKRNELKKVDIKRISPDQLDGLETSRMALFQYMIGNVDWSILKGPGVELCCHNAKLIGPDPGGKLYAIPYDFDASGLVDAEYAAPNAGLPISDVKQRLYRGFCMHNAALETARQEYLAKEQAIYALVKNENRLGARHAKVALRYLGEFFDTLRNENKFNKNIIQKCRR